MKIFMVGCTGLLGYQGAKELIKRGHKVKGIALPPIPDKLRIPKGMEVKLGNYLEMSDAELKKCFKGCKGFVFAAGIDERIEGKAPIYDLFYKYNIDSLKRLLEIAKVSKVKKVVILGSYFSHFAKIWPELELEKHHPYIKSRIDQEKMAFEYAKEGMDIAILEIPYVFGAQKNRKPVWQFIAEMIKDSKGKSLYYPKGGTTMVTVKQVGECIAGALENTEGAKAYPVGWHNISWKEWLEKFSKYMNMPKKIITIPTFLYKIAAKAMAKDIKRKGLESGLNMVEYTKIMTANCFIDKKTIQKELGVKNDNIDKAIKESAEICLEIINNPEKNIVDMKTE